MQPAPQGLLIELPTPLLDEGGLDARGLARLVRRAAPAAHAMAVAGPLAGQGQRLGEDIWRGAVETALSAAPKRLPLLVGLAAAESRTVLARARWLASQSQGREIWGLDLALYHHSNRGLPAWLDELASALGRPVILANLPDQVRGRRGPARHLNLMPKVAAKCGESLAGVIHAGSLKLGRDFSRALAARPLARLYEGDELSFLSRPASAGLLSPGAAIMPEAWRLLTDSALGLAQEGLTGPKERRALIQAGVLARELGGLMASRPAAMACLLAHALGLGQSPRAPGPRLEEAVRRAALAWLEKSGLSQ
ncbi:hypothetical protein AAU61_02600 [Desulfocarbo indianensis]|nr:hypothetical protein AAU61_02600 [Desulfocarbo indianensis]